MADSPTFYDTGRPFAPYYNMHILPRVAEFEAARQVAVTTLRNHTLLAIPAGLACAAAVAYFGFYKNPDIDPGIFFMGGLLAFSGLTAWCYAPVKNFKKSIKSKIFPLVFAFFEGGFTYTDSSPIGVEDLAPSRLIPSYDTERRGDYVHGQHKGVELEFLETKLTKTTGTGKNKRTETVFKGIFVRLQAHKKFKGRTLVKKDYGFMNWANGSGSLQRVRLEDPVFEKQFEVFADDQVEARYLLTTSFMDRLLKLTELFKTNGLECSFYDNRLLIKIPTAKNYFETGSIFKPVTFRDDINTILEEMHSFFSIIETLKLDERTGL